MLKILAAAGLLATGAAAKAVRVAVLFLGSHHPAHLATQKELLIEPLQALGATVDVFVVGNNHSKSWPTVMSAYSALSNGIFASGGSDEHSSSSLSSSSPQSSSYSSSSAAAGLRLLLSSSPSSSSSSTPWTAVLVWRSAIAPLIAATELAFVPGGLVVPWREMPAGGLPLRSSAPSKKAMMKTCMDVLSRWQTDARGLKVPGAAFWFDGAILERVATDMEVQASVASSQQHASFLQSSSGLRSDELVHFAIPGFWESARAVPNPLLDLHSSNGDETASSLEAAAGASRHLHFHCCRETGNDAIGRLRPPWTSIGAAVTAAVSGGGGELAVAHTLSPMFEKCEQFDSPAPAIPTASRNKNVSSSLSSGSSSDVGGPSSHHSRVRGVLGGLTAPITMALMSVKHALGGHQQQQQQQQQQHHYPHSSADQVSTISSPSSSTIPPTPPLPPLQSSVAPPAPPKAVQQTTIAPLPVLATQQRHGNRTTAATAAVVIGGSGGVGGSGTSLVTAGHVQELTRLELIEWSRYGTKVTMRKGEANKVGTFSNEPCFGGCAPLTPLSGTKGEFPPTQHDKHGPATFSLVIPWCCEWVSFILKEVDFKGHLREIFLYDKCSHSVSFFYCRSWRWIHLCLFNSSLSFLCGRD